MEDRQMAVFEQHQMKPYSSSSLLRFPGVLSHSSNVVRDWILPRKKLSSLFSVLHTSRTPHFSFLEAMLTLFHVNGHVFRNGRRFSQLLHRMRKETNLPTTCGRLVAHLCAISKTFTTAFVSHSPAAARLNLKGWSQHSKTLCAKGHISPRGHLLD